MIRISPSRLYTYTTIGSQRCSIINNQSGAERFDTGTGINRRKLSSSSRYPTQHQAGPARVVGQNLSDRYLRLEKSLRSKEALSKELDGYDSHNSESVTQSNPRRSKSSSKPVQLFRGFEIPEEPKPPADDGLFSLFSFGKPSFSMIFTDSFY